MTDLSLNRQTTFIKFMVVLILCVAAAFGAVSNSKVFILPTVGLVALAVGVFLLRHPAIFFWGIVFTAPITDHLAINLGPFNVRPYNLLAAGGVCWFLLNILANNFSTPVMQNFKKGLPWFLPLLLLFAMKILGALNANSDYLYIPLKFPLKFLLLAGLTYLSCFIVYAFCTSKAKIEGTLKYWLHLSNFIVALAIVQVILSNVAGFHFVHHRHIIWFGRPYSVFREPDVLGSFAAATVMMTIPLIIFKTNIVNRKYLYFTLMTNAFMMIFILVRAAWLGFLFTGVFTYISLLLSKTEIKARPYMNKAILVSLTCMIALPILMPSLSVSLFGRLTSIAKPKGEGASAYRMMELEHMVQKALPTADPQSVLTFLIGHGDFTWSYWGPELAGDAYNQDSKTSTTVLVHPGYCMLLTYLFDNGIVGALLISLFFLIMSIRYYRLLQTDISEESKSLLMASYLPQIVILICFQFSYDPITPFMWILTGVHIAWAGLCTQNLNHEKGGY
ncbi:MAG: hypothetical protein MK132_19945 [Lentisphaerales bacterium]|nr:hypothetical protein [Lentisphaerales bacterium]